MKRRVNVAVLLSAIVSLLIAASVAGAAVDKVICVPWQGDPLKQHTALSGTDVQLKGVIRTTDASAIYYKWVFGDGSESGITTLSGYTKYNVAATHAYTAAAGTPFTAILQVSNTNPFTVAKEDPYLVKLEGDSQDARINIAIDNGLWWLYNQAQSNNPMYGPNLYSWLQTYDNSTAMGWVQTSSVGTLAAPTASAIHAFGINGHKKGGNPDEDPYAEAVQLGMNYLINGYFSSPNNPALKSYVIGTLDRGAGVIDNPDANGNGYGIEVYDNYSHTPYQTGQVMDAIIASGAQPGEDTGRNFAGSGTHTWTYKELLQDLADMYAWGQWDGANCNGTICGSWWYTWNYSYPGDNSASQWGAIGLIPAQQPPWNVVVPQWVKTYNANWLEYSHCTYDSAHHFFSYNSPCGCAGDYCFQTTTSALVQMVMDGQTTSDPKWAPSLLTIVDNWYYFLHAGSTWGGYMTYGWYSFAKAMRLSLPTPTTEIAKSVGTPFDWYHGDLSATSCTGEGDCRKGLAQRILETQSTDGAWRYGNLTDPPLTTAWMIITLNPTLFESAPIACFTMAPNPSFADLPVSFDPGCSSHSEPGKTIANLTSFQWDWDNNGTFEASTPGPAVQTHSFACPSLPCSYPVKLKVTDDSNPPRSATTILSVDITNPPHPPVAKAGGPYMVSTCSSDTLALNGSASFDQDQGQHQSGCDSCPGDAITAWDWDLVPPSTFDAIDVSTEKPLLTAAQIVSLLSIGTQNIGLRVTDNTALAYPVSGKPNLTDAAFSSVKTSTGCLCSLVANSKTTMVQLNWSAAEHTPSTSYNIYRSTTGPNTGFVLIKGGYTNIYPLYLDSGLTNGTTYWYRVEKVLPTGGTCASVAVSAKPMLPKR